MVMTDVTSDAIIAIVYHISPDLSIWNTDFQTERAGEADGLFDPGSWK
jgi:hypothetical protein